MKEISYVVNNTLGIHARPAALLAQCCVNFKSQVRIYLDEKVADGDNVLQILALGAKKGDTLRLDIDGDDEEVAAKAIEELLHGAFEEKKPVDVLKIAFFGTKDYDRTFFSELVKDKGQGTYNSDIKYFDSQLGPETAGLAQGYDAVCIFVNDNASRPVVEKLHECGVKLILLRCAGLNRRLHKAYTKVKDNNFALSGLLGLDLHNKVAGIMGTGKIGQCMARICKGYGMTVLGWDAYPNQALVDEGLLTYVSKEELLKRADLISLHCPLIMGDNGTYHLINDETIALMKDTVMLVNTSRGPIIDPEALIRALKQGKFHAVALDVYEGEDNNVYTDKSDVAITNDITARLQMFPQLVLTSHQAFFTREALQAIAVVTMENARNFNEGNELGSAECKA